MLTIMPQNCFCPPGTRPCSMCKMRHNTALELAAWLTNDRRNAWDVYAMSKLENQEMKIEVREQHARDWQWKREYDKLKHQREEHARQLRQQQLLWKQKKETEQRMLEQQQQERLEEERKQKLQEQAKREQLLDNEHRKQLQFQREFAFTVQEHRLLWKLNNNAANQEHPQPDRAPRSQRSLCPPRPLRPLRPPPATGTMPVL